MPLQAQTERQADDARRRASRAAFFARLRARLPVETEVSPRERSEYRLAAGARPLGLG